MQKTIGHRAIIEVDGFHDAKNWIYRCIRDGVVKCGQCDQPATNVFWQDRAEWYCRCEQHREYGDQWTGSTRWNPSSLSLNIIKEKAVDWMESLPEPERTRVKLRSYDATDYYALITEDEQLSIGKRHYFEGQPTGYGNRIYARLYPLTNGEFAYELHHDNLNEHFGYMYGFGIRGAWKTETAAIEAAAKELEKRRKGH